MRVNGEQITLEAPCSIQDFLTSHRYPNRRLAVEHNGEIVPRNRFEQTMLCDSDRIEIVCFVGGG